MGCPFLQFSNAAPHFISFVELLDEVEFGETSESTRYDENSVKPAIELGLMVCITIYMS